MLSLKLGWSYLPRAFVVSLSAWALLFVLADGGAGAAERSEQQAKVFIESLAQEAIDALAKAEVSEEEREARFRRMLNTNFAVPDIGRWVLGRHWARATPEERVEYLKLFEELIVSTYLRRFSLYSGETLNVGRGFLSQEGGDVLVDSQIVGPGNEEPVFVGWRVRTYEDGPRIVDVIVEGVSMGQTQRSEFGSVIRRNGGTVAGLLEELRQMVQN